MPNTKIDVEPTSRHLSQLRDDVDDLLARLATAESQSSWWLTGCGGPESIECPKYVALLGN